MRWHKPLDRRLTLYTFTTSQSMLALHRCTAYVCERQFGRVLTHSMCVQVRDIVRQTADARQVLLFSATLPSALAEFTQVGLRSPELVRLDADTKLSPDLKLTFLTVRAGDKPAALLQVLRDLLPAQSPTIVFAATKHRIEYLSVLLQEVRSLCYVEPSRVFDLALMCTLQLAHASRY